MSFFRTKSQPPRGAESALKRLSSATVMLNQTYLANRGRAFTIAESLIMLVVMFVFTWLLLGIMRKDGIPPFPEPKGAVTPGKAATESSVAK